MESIKLEAYILFSIMIQKIVRIVSSGNICLVDITYFEYMNEDINSITASNNEPNWNIYI